MDYNHHEDFLNRFQLNVRSTLHCYIGQWHLLHCIMGQKHEIHAAEKPLILYCVCFQKGLRLF